MFVRHECSHDLLLKKLPFYGLDKATISWIESYLHDRVQCVAIEGTLSKMLPVESGVPQGSILGPLLYTLFTNELPEVINDDQGPETVRNYRLNGDDESSICCYADDTTLSCSSKSTEELTRKLTNKYETVATFMRDNNLKLNDDKLHLIVLDIGLSKTRYENSRNVRYPNIFYFS